MKRAFAIILLCTPLPSAAQQRMHLPARPGVCASTRVKDVTQRLEDGNNRVLPNTGSVITFTNGLYLVSYDEIEAANQSRRGDRATVCLVRLPRHCPPGDDRGKIYKATNLRTGRSWTMADSEHMCGGA